MTREPMTDKPFTRDELRELLAQLKPEQAKPCMCGKPATRRDPRRELWCDECGPQWPLIGRG